MTPTPLLRKTIAPVLASCALATLGCEEPADLDRASPSMVGELFSIATVREDPRPTLLLIVLDTTRADAISAYGGIEGTTPNVDAIAGRGTLFANAYAPSPWTISSHATLFSGLRVDEHGVGLDGVYRIDDGVALIAEALSDAGYETAAFAENVVLGPEFGFDRGFDHYEVTTIREILEAESQGDTEMSWFSIASRVRRWSAMRDPSRPAFVFVNIMDPHGPWKVRPTNRWTPEEATTRELEGVIRRYTRPDVLCRRVPSYSDRELLRGLYMGDVAAADRKLRDVLEALRGGFEDEPTITVVTADHGEHLGEHDLLGHRFTVRTPAVHIPLIVEGAPDLAPGTVDAAVGLQTLHASLRCWGLGEACGRSLSAPPDEPIISIWSDDSSAFPKALLDQLGVAESDVAADGSRTACDKDDPVFGELVSLIRYPLKANWAGAGVHSLHDLSWDPKERSDQRGRMGETGGALEAELTSFVADRLENRTPLGGSELSEEQLRALEALGYVD
ncbi:MAG: sulfatase [Myxococcota bacterium]